MRLTLAEPKYFKDSISIISELVNEACFKITPEAIEMIAMDPANVAMVIFKLLSSTFTEYKVDQDTEIAINLNNLKQILRRTKPSDMLTLELDNNKLKLTLQGNSKRTFSIPIIELDEKEQKIPDLNFGASIVMPTEFLTDAIEDVDIVAESVTFQAEPEKLVVEATGDLSKARIDINKADDVNIETQDKIKAKYSIEYLKKMMGGSKLANQVSLYFSKDYPLKLEYKEMDRLMLSFILAPRVEND
ncbi:proliferating cell nuclear antigen (pcna) [Candidatus Woesearchaeota archaeon]|nr:proliferating cell nuclear antigen (pcna) [Candidatus Woesearchaeota archaeon]